MKNKKKKVYLKKVPCKKQLCHIIDKENIEKYCYFYTSEDNFCGEKYKCKEENPFILIEVLGPVNMMVITPASVL